MLDNDIDYCLLGEMRQGSSFIRYVDAGNAIVNYGICLRTRSSRKSELFWQHLLDFACHACDPVFAWGFALACNANSYLSRCLAAQVPCLSLSPGESPGYSAHGRRVIPRRSLQQYIMKKASTMLQARQADSSTARVQLIATA
eukprot:6173661-Pleurochrysis_carterae.AAC.2